MKRIAILGSTGSIGESALKVARHLKNDLQVVALAAHSNIDKLEAQAREFQPQIIAVFNKDKALELARRLPNIRVVGGMEGLEELAAHPESDYLLSAINGSAGLLPTIAAIKTGKDIGLATKEVLVCAGELITSLARQYKVKLLPVDSEHSAIFQCLDGEAPETIKRLIITASGGPFRLFDQQRLNQITVEQALTHPTWKMGPKITIDSSTLMNKGLEVIEAHWLFNQPLDKIQVVVHPQSIIHSMVEFIDGSLLAQLGTTDMVTPIQYALTYPNRRETLLEPFDILKYPKLEFFAPDTERFRCLGLAYEAARVGQSVPCYLNAANEVVVDRFLKREISWTDIGSKLEKLIAKHTAQQVTSLSDVLEIDRLAREEARCA